MRNNAVLRGALASVAAAAVLFTTGIGDVHATGQQQAPKHRLASGVVGGSKTSGAALPGANKWRCRPTAKHPRPVVLIHGTMGSVNTWRSAAPLLARNGYCVFALNYGSTAATGPFHGVGRIAHSAATLARFIDRVRAATGASEVDLVGHSQGGGPLPRYYLKNFPGAARKVGKLIGIVPSNHGTTLHGLTTLGRQLNVLQHANKLVGTYPALVEQQAGSKFNRRLDAGGDTVPGVDYTVIATRFDEIVTPYTNGFLTAGRGARVHNLTVQKACPLNATEHLTAPYDPVALSFVLNALDPAHRRPVRCQPVLPLFGPVI